MKKLLTLLALLMSATGMTAQSATDGTSIIQEKDTVWGFGANGIYLYKRKMHRIDIAYQTTDPKGNPCRMNGVIIIPKDVWDGEQICDGMVLYNHYAQMAKKDAPSRGYATGEDMVLANPLNPNYTMVIPDFYGFGITEDQDQWFCFGDANGHASIDCLLAARALLTERGQSLGKYLINAGYSSGGYDAIAAQKVRDMEYKDQISFDRTVVGGLPFDISEAYDQFIKNKDQYWRVFGLLMILDSYNRHADLGFTPEQVLKSPYDEKFDEWVHSGKYTTSDILEVLKDKKLEEVIQEPFLTLNSKEYKKLCKAFDAHALSKGWVPDPTQNYDVFHFYKDGTVPCSSDRKLLSFLSNYYWYWGSKNPFQKSIIPEKTHLHTNFIMPFENHSPIGGITFYIGLTATMVSMPVLYYDGELNTYYADLINDLTPLEIVKAINGKINVKDLIQKAINGGNEGGNIFNLIARLIGITTATESLLSISDLTMADLMTMADDSGVSVIELLQIVSYLNSAEASANTPDAGSEADTATDGDINESPFLIDYYINYLTNWFKEKTGIGATSQQ